MFKFVMTKNSLELFHRAVIHNDVKRVRLILEEAMKDPRFNIDDINDDGLTALQFSCFAGNLEVVKTLVSYGANIRIRDRDGHTVLHAAAMAGCSEVVKYLLRSGLKPTVRTDDGYMPIDVTDEVAIIVILLRSMLDQGFLKEMQDYMIDHPKLKRNIFEELEKVKCRENEKNEILKELPYTSRASPRKSKPDRIERLKDRPTLGRSRSTFSELSDSMQHLDKILTDYDDNNNTAYEPAKEPIYEEVRDHTLSNKNTTLHRNNSTSSAASYSSRSSTGSGGILRHPHEIDQTHQNMQRYLENRYPIHNKSVTFDLQNSNGHRSYSDGYISDSLSSSHGDYDHLFNERRAYSDGYLSDNYDDTSFRQRSATVSRTSSMSSQSSHRSEPIMRSNRHDQYHLHPGFNEQSRISNYEHMQSHVTDENSIYENMSKLKKQAMPTIRENHYENLPPRSNGGPPPIPPREPQDGSEVTDRQLGSETDSGIDINETSGRVFALSLEDQQQQMTSPNTSSITSLQQTKTSSYSKPIGLYYSNQSQGVSAKQENDKLPIGSFIIKNGGNNKTNKYMSWNGRTIQDSQQYEPYQTHKPRMTKDDCDMYPTNSSQNARNDFLNYNFDHQPDIML